MPQHVPPEHSASQGVYHLPIEHDAASGEQEQQVARAGMSVRVGA